MNTSLHAASIFPSLVLFSNAAPGVSLLTRSIFSSSGQTRFEPGCLVPFFFPRAFIFLFLRLPFPALIFPTNFAHSNLI